MSKYAVVTELDEIAKLNERLSQRLKKHFKDTFKMMFSSYQMKVTTFVRGHRTEKVTN